MSSVLSAATESHTFFYGIPVSGPRPLKNVLLPVTMLC